MCGSPIEMDGVIGWGGCVKILEMEVTALEFSQKLIGF
jgi:hypothetical protein